VTRVIELSLGGRGDRPGDAPRLEPYDERHLGGVLALCAQLGWRSYSDHPDVARRAWTAPGVTTVVAVLGEDVVGFASLLGDGVVQGYLAQLAVVPTWRRRGVARGLVQHATRLSGVRRVDLLTEDAQDFYASLPHRVMYGFRVYPLT